MLTEDYIMEDKLIKKAMSTTINKCQNDPKNAKHEIMVQDWLYNELCDELGKINPEYPCRIREEYLSYKKKEENKHLPNSKQYWKDTYPKYIEHERPFTFDGKVGKYDLVILDGPRNKILYAIEVKEITSYDSEIHRGYEDIYVLSDLLRMHNNVAKGYILIVAWYNSKPRARKTKQGMQEYLEKVHRAHNNAGIYCQSTILDEALL